jgi:Flp pilus assembly protein TadG
MCSARLQHGQAFVEFALIFPVFVLLVMGALQIALLCMVTVSLQGLAQDTARWMAISSQADRPAADCTLTTNSSNWPRPRWANGDDGSNYVKCTAPPILRAANFSTPVWSPACGNGSDCFATGARAANQMLTVTLTYNWSNVIIMPFITGGGIVSAWQLPTTITATASEVMQY